MALAQTFVSSSIVHASTGVTYHFSKPVEYGYYWNGDVFVVSNGQDVTITRIEPESATDAGRIVNGTMLQPHESVGKTGFDSAAGKGPSFSADDNDDPGYTGASLTVAFDAYPNGASVVKAVSLPDLSAQRDRSSIDKFSVLTVTPETPPEGAFRPAVSGDDKTSVYTVADLDFSKLQSVAPVPGQPDISEFDHLKTATFVSWSGGSEGLRYLHPNAYHDGYGDYQLDDLVDAFVALHSDSSTAEKQDLYAALVQTGLDYAGAVQNGVSWIPDGGHNNEYKPFVVLAASALNSEDLTQAAQTPGAFSEDKQFQYVEEDDIGRDVFNFVINKNPILGSTYQEMQLGMPEWVIEDARSDPNIGASYRWHNSDNVPILALAMEMLGDGEGRDIWGNEAYFDYAVRVQNMFEVNLKPVWNSNTHKSEQHWFDFVSQYAQDYSSGASMQFAPEVPIGLEVQPIEGGIDVQISGDVFPGDAPVQRVDIRYTQDGDTWTLVEDFGMSGQISGLTETGVYLVQARYVNTHGEGPWSLNLFDARNSTILDALLDTGIVSDGDIAAVGGPKHFMHTGQYREALNNILSVAEGYEDLAAALLTATVVVDTAATPATPTIDDISFDDPWEGDIVIDPEDIEAAIEDGSFGFQIGLDPSADGLEGPLFWLPSTVHARIEGGELVLVSQLSDGTTVKNSTIGAELDGATSHLLAIQYDGDALQVRVDGALVLDAVLPATLDVASIDRETDLTLSDTARETSLLHTVLPVPNSQDSGDITATQVAAVNGHEGGDGGPIGSFTLLQDAPGTPAPEQSQIGEVHTITLNHKMVTLDLDGSYDNPVVIAKSSSFAGSQPAEVRVSDVQDGKVTLFIDEPGYLDGKHLTEEVTVFVLEAGSHILPDGTRIEAGTMDTSKLWAGKDGTAFDTVTFDSAFDATPAVLSQVQSANEDSFVVTRQHDADSGGFRLGLSREEALSKTARAEETVGWVAIEHGSGDWSGLAYEAGSTGRTVDHRGHDHAFETAFDAEPALLAGLASRFGPDTAINRVTSVDDTGFRSFVQEEKSRDSETRHTDEAIDYIAFGDTGALMGYEVNDAPVDMSVYSIPNV